MNTEFTKRWMNTRVSQTYDALVIGGGAAGMLAAGTAAARGLRTCLVEKNARPGRKLMITGKGRCNVTNDCDVRELIASVPSNGRFLYSAASAFPPRDVMAFFEAQGFPLKVERGNRVFPTSDHAVDVVDTLIRYMKRSGVEMLTGEAKQLLLEDGTVQGAELQGGARILARNVLVACGGVSYPGTGSTGDGYAFARQAGHIVTPLRPSLVPLVAAGTDCPEMMGLSLKNTAIHVWDTKKRKRFTTILGRCFSRILAFPARWS